MPAVAAKAGVATSMKWFAVRVFERFDGNVKLCCTVAPISERRTWFIIRFWLSKVVLNSTYWIVPSAFENTSSMVHRWNVADAGSAAISARATTSAPRIQRSSRPRARGPRSKTISFPARPHCRYGGEGRLGLAQPGAARTRGPRIERPLRAPLAATGEQRDASAEEQQRARLRDRR